VKPRSGGNSSVEDGTLTATLPKKSWNMIRLGK
jgi:alpha-L-arabinofuranosidase